MTSSRSRIQLAVAIGLVALLGAALAAAGTTGSSAGGRAPAVVPGGRSPVGPGGNGATLGAEAGAESLLAAPAPGADRLDGASPAPGPASGLPGSTRVQRVTDRRSAGITSAGQLRPRSPPGDRTS